MTGIETYKKGFQALHGERLKAVRYYELAGIRDSWSVWPDFDTIDHGLDLVMESGRVFLVTWAQTFIQYDLDVRPGLMVDELLASTVTNVSSESRWKNIIGQSITDVTLFWEDIDDLSSQGLQCVQDMCLTFESGATVYLSTSEYREDDWWLGMMDNIVVFFDTQSFQRRQFKAVTAQEGSVFFQGSVWPNSLREAEPDELA